MKKSSEMMPMMPKRSQKTNTEFSNEEPNAKIIKLSKMATKNVDPLVYFSRFLDIPEMILNHLKLFGKGLIIISKVSPLWYNFIASSKVLMENIKVVFNEKRELQKEDYDLLKNSSRMYQNIEIRADIDMLGAYDHYFSTTEFRCVSNSELDFFISKARDWKSVLITATKFRTKLDLYKFLSSIESSVESFTVRNRFNGDAFAFEDGSFSNLKSYKVLKFPKLKHVRMDFYTFCVMGEIYAEFLVNSIAIERFAFKDAFGFTTIDSVLTKMLENFNSLTSLSLKIRQSDLFDDETWKRFQFKLKSLTIIDDRSRELHNTNLWDFIKSQKDHLEELTIDLDNDNENFALIMRLPKLKILNLGNIRTLLKDDFPNIPNVISNSITHLRCRQRESADTLKFFMKSMPNVKNLHLAIIGNKSFPALLELNRKYEEIRVGNLVDGVQKKDLKVLLTNENNKCVVESWFFPVD